MDLTDAGKIKRVRGSAISCRVPPTSAARVSHSAKGLLQRLIPDVWISTDAHSGSKTGAKGCGPSAGLKVVLTSESTTDVVMTAEACLDTSVERGKVLPEDLGHNAASMLLEEVDKGGCVDTVCQSLVFILMCLCPEDVSKVTVGTLSKYSIRTLRLLKASLGVEFKVRPDEETKTVTLSCLGTGFKNQSKKVT